MHEIDAFRWANDKIAHRTSVHDDTPHTEFPRMPPNPFGKPRMPVHERVSKLSMHHKVNPNPAHDIDEFKYGFIQQANNLFAAGTLPIPPGHPLYNKQLTLAALESERDMLLKENAELKQRLEDNKKNNESDIITTDR